MCLWKLKGLQAKQMRAGESHESKGDEAEGSECKRLAKPDMLIN